ncbi:MAG: hypothetical protein Q8Q63_06445 [Phaeovulum sp.]|uniref:hydrolase n=1 Tax=Phaeovulum sp. TaxID=2934796 RepID=UPI002730CDF7|nr:hydrolase [Phaeovulum sp.]MDP2063737.1 hypothetical protein [Phaeovulum sp.]MDP3861209.1 hypothetical protein [Phaeovulum sp.]
MNMNVVPRLDTSTNTTGCCAKFNPEGWDGAEVHFRDKAFLRALTRSVMHIPLNWGTVFGRVLGKLDAGAAVEPEGFVVLSRELSPWSAEHLFAIRAAVPGEEVTTLSGDFVTKVFEGSFAEARHWHEALQAISAAHGKPDGQAYFYYTTCPKCAKAYGKNYVVGFAEV